MQPRVLRKPFTRVFSLLMQW